MLILKTCLVSSNYDIAKEPVMNDLVDVACNLEFTAKRETAFLFHNASLQFFFSFLFVFLLFFFFGQRTDDIQNCSSFFAFTFTFIQKNSMKENCNYGTSVLD